MGIRGEVIHDQTDLNNFGQGIRLLRCPTMVLCEGSYVNCMVCSKSPEQQHHPVEQRSDSKDGNRARGSSEEYLDTLVSPELQHAEAFPLATACASNDPPPTLFYCTPALALGPISLALAFAWHCLHLHGLDFLLFLTARVLLLRFLSENELGVFVC